MATVYFANQYFSTTLNVGGGINNSQTTGIVVQSRTGLDATKPGIACLSYSDPINTSNAEWITYTSIDTATNELQGVARGAEGFSAKAHANGVTIAFPISESHINNLATALSIGGVATNAVSGTIAPGDTSTNAATEIVTKSYVDADYKTATDGATVTFDLGNGGYRKHKVTLGGNRTLAISNSVVGQAFIIDLIQDGTGGRTVTWFSTIKWTEGAVPTLTTTANKTDTFGFIVTSAGNYQGYIVGQNL
jgi:hypothetical protein